MPLRVLNQRLFDARPDRVDYRDRPYNPPLVSLPDTYPEPGFITRNMPSYVECGLVLDQGKEGACTGFGLAAVINYLMWKRQLDRDGKPPQCDSVSPRMLYHLARIYDEWAGEDYEGSSCRGAMKGWHRHGVCRAALWPYRDARGRVRLITPREGWQTDAAERPLGAYYRVNKDSVADLQAAIHEVGAVYVSSLVHDGWFLDTAKKLPIIRNPKRLGDTGGHAFSLVGYMRDGFVVQNSWGPEWGYCGFALLPYEDWVMHGSDAWVAVLGAPVTPSWARDSEAPRARATVSLNDSAAGRAEWFWRSDKQDKGFAYRNPRVQPLGASAAYDHALVLGNNGVPLNRFVDLYHAHDAVERVGFAMPLTWLSETGSQKIAIYAHGGLNDEDASMKRVRVMTPYFLENGVYPIFVVWRTGFLESIGGILSDAVGKFFSGEAVPPATWLGDWLRKQRNQLREAADRSIEVACENLLVKSVWVQMKQNAEAAAQRRADAGLRLLAGHLADLTKQIDGLEIHLVGHSAGGILLGHLLAQMKQQKLASAGCTLLAPACSVDFALDAYGKALRDGRLGALHVHNLNDERERADSVGPYGKSLLYLVSRALDRFHKIPLLGMEHAWTPDAAFEQDIWSRTSRETVRMLDGLQKLGAQAGVRHAVVSRKSAKTTADGSRTIAMAHGAFDNDVEVVSEVLRRIRGGKLAAEVESLAGF